MFKLLVDAPTGVQELIHVAVGGGYFDQARVLWDERTDGPLPAITLGGMVRAGDALAFDQAAFDASAASALAGAKDAKVLKIDAGADAIRNAVLGGRTTEYQEALADAQAFAAAGFAGTVPPGVKSWLDAKTAVGAGWTAQQAAQDILDTGAAWKAAQDAIRSHRLLRKEQVRAATTLAQTDDAMAAWGAFTVYIRAQLGLA